MTDTRRKPDQRIPWETGEQRQRFGAKLFTLRKNNSEI
jgi:hypothetical protein